MPQRISDYEVQAFIDEWPSDTSNQPIQLLIALDVKNARQQLAIAVEALEEILVNDAWEPEARGLARAALDQIKKAKE